MKRTKALIQIFVILCSIFATSITLESVTAVGEKCCQRTNAGEYCQYVDQDQCDSAGKSSFTTCEKTYFCEVGCCGTEEGDYFVNAPRSLCVAKGGTFYDDPTCESVPQAEKGCCVLGNECSYLTQTKCKAVVSNYPELEMVFDSSVESEVECINQCRSAEKGCCVSGDECVFGTRESCGAGVGELTNETQKSDGFFKDLFCSNNKLTCDCAPHHHKGCVDYSDDVYWFDSCGNLEDVADQCDYASGSLCGKDNDDFKCLDINCKDTYADAASPNTGGEKKSGESWCVYDASVGFGADVVGSRHYRHICINGQEISYPCADYREEMCISGVVDFGADKQGVPENPFAPGFGDYIEAACIPNRWQDCSSCDYEVKTDVPPTEDEVEDAIECCNKAEARDCFWTGDENAGKCLPHVPPAFKFWEGEGQDICSKGAQECTVVFAKSGLSDVSFLDSLAEYKGKGRYRGWEVLANEVCLGSDWLANVNSYCKSLGDCGAYYNVEGKVSMAGFDSSISDIRFAQGKFSEKDVGTWTQIAKGQTGWNEPDKYEQLKKGAIVWGVIGLWSGFSSWNQGKEFMPGFQSGFFSGFMGIFNSLVGAKDWITSTFTKTSVKESALKGTVGKTGLREGTATVTKGTLLETGTIVDPNSFARNQNLYDSLVQQGHVNGETGEVLKPFKSPRDVKVVQQPGQFWKTVNTIYTIYMILKIWDALDIDTKEVTVKAECSPWQAPTGYNDCEKCNEKEFKPCTEYTCKSLGAACGLINEGTEEEKCVYAHPYDTKSPIIKPDDTVLTKDYSYSVLAYGFRLNPKVKAFSRFTFGIKTDEPAQCKISDKIGTTFDDMSNYFGTSLYLYNHSMAIVVPKEATEDSVLAVTNGGNYEFYVRCQDTNGNKNERDYLIQFSVDKGPDLTVPSIEATSIVNGAYAPSGTPEMDLSVYVTEPGLCSWDSNDVAFETMNNKMQCKTGGLNPSNNLYECTTTLTGIEDNKENIFYFKCMDFAGNDMRESYVYKLFGTDPLEITDVGPTGQQYEPLLYVRTAGGANKDGSAICGFSDEEDSNTMVTFITTSSNYHEQELIVPEGDHTFYVECVDTAGNIAKDSTSFNMFVDKEGPEIIRIYEDKSTITPKLHITTDEKSTCEYTTTGDFVFGEGIRMPEDETIEHEATWGADIYYVICQDMFENLNQVVRIYT